MRFLIDAPRYLFFTGKGGVGKTSVACASALNLARAGKRVLLVSTDPASNLGQVFSLAIGDKITAIPGQLGLSALEIDPQRAAAVYRDRIVGPVRGVLPDGVVREIEEQLSGACTTEIAAFDEFTGLLTDSELANRFDHVVFDTAPTGHTLRLLKLPGAWSEFLEAGRGDASCLGPLAGLEKQRSRYQAAVDVLSDRCLTMVVLVSRAQRSALLEAERTANELSEIGVEHLFLVINGLLPEGEAKVDRLARGIFARERLALSEMPLGLRQLPSAQVSLKPFNMVGTRALDALFVEQGEDLADTPVGGFERGDPRLCALIDELALAGRGLIMVMGKGGVGKTTLAAAIAVELARRGNEVSLTTSDPAAHLEQTLSGALERLKVSRIDPELESQRYREEVLAARGAGLDEKGRALLEEDLRSPCTQEIAVFRAFSQAIDQAKSRFVVIDTAPTGHTLLLLDATGAYHREVQRRVKSGGSNDGVAEARELSTPLTVLRDPDTTKILLVTLAETTPVLEAAELQEDLRRAGIEPWGWVVNNSLAAARPSGGLLRQRAFNEAPLIDRVREVYSKRYAVVPLLESEPVGIDGLTSLARS